MMIPHSDLGRLPEADMKTGDHFMALLARRHSTRMFQEQAVPSALIERLVKAATLLPTSCNRQLWHFIAVTDPDLKMKISTLSDAQQSYLYDAPVLIAVFYDTSLEVRNPCNTAEITAGMSISALLLAAEAYGLGAIYLGGIRRPAGIGKALGVPNYLKCFGLVCVGWRDDAPPSPNHRSSAEVLSLNTFNLPHRRFPADIRPHLWNVAQIADFRDKLLWYKGVHIDGKTLHVDADTRVSQLFQFMIGRIGSMLSTATTPPRVLDVLAFNGDVTLQLINAYTTLISDLYAYDLTPGIARYITERFKRLGLPRGCICLANEHANEISIPLPDHHIQLMVCYERLEHFEDPRPLLREMRRVLAPHGRVLVLVSNRFYPHLYRYKRMREKNYALGRNWNRGPERKYEPAHIEHLFRESGFTITASFGLQPVYLKILSLGISLLRRWGWHNQADRWSDYAAQRFVTTGFFRKLSSTLAYELE